MSQITILVGAQWGDEGKGKWVDILAEQVDMVARYQGGNNAGHTLYVNGEKVVLHQIPSGIFRPKTIAALTAGVVINPVQMVEEMKVASKYAAITPERLWLSARAHVITPWHIHIDGKREQAASQPIGTTKRGIGPTYADKYARHGLRLGYYLQPEKREKWRREMRQEHAGFDDAVSESTWELFCSAADALLDIDHGTYPFVTSSSTMAGGALASLGCAPRLVDKVYGVAKAYLTRVGEGPFPTELFDENGKKLAELGHEFGATTGRPRRCGWLDGVALKHSYHANGLDGVILNKIDILSSFASIKLCVAYEHPELGRIDDFPWDPDVIAECKPVYEEFAGWNEPLDAKKPMAAQPAALRQYVAAIEKLIGGKVSMIGTGTNREDALFVEN